MIAFRQTDARYPFLWESDEQPAARWHGAGEGPAHYFADTPVGAWAEFIRHEEIMDPEDLATIRRRIWAVDIGDAPAQRITLPPAVATGDLATYPRCQAEARRLRARGARRLIAPSAALKPGAAHGVIVNEGEQRGPSRDGVVIIAFGAPQVFTGWLVANDAQPPADILDHVRHYRGPR